MECFQGSVRWSRVIFYASGLCFSSKFFHVAIFQRPAELVSKPLTQREGESDQCKVPNLEEKQKRNLPLHLNFSKQLMQILNVSMPLLV